MSRTASPFVRPRRRGIARRLSPVVSRVGLVAGLLLSTACARSEAAPEPEKPLPHVRTAEVKLIAPRPRSRHLAPLVAHRRARLSPRVGGQVLVLSADEEQNVQQGATLVRFSARDSRGGLESAKGNIAQLEESLRDTERELEDARNLLNQGAGTSREVERIETQQATLQAQLSSAKGTLTQARDRLGAASIQAPFSGTVTSVQTEVGEFIAPGQVAIVLAELDPISVEVPLTQSEVQAYDRAGLEFVVRARGESRTATVDYVSSESADGATFTARLDLANADHKLRDGELVDVEVFGAKQPQVQAVPFTAIRWAADQAYVLAVRDGTVSRVDVTVRDESEQLVVFDGPLQPGTPVVETGPVALRDGDAVEVVAAPAETLASG